MTTPRTACKHCDYMTRMIDTAICTDCQDAITDTPAPFLHKTMTQDEAISNLFASLEVGLEGCPAFDHLDDPQDAMLTAESWNTQIDGRQSSTRYLTIEGTRYSIRIQQEKQISCTTSFTNKQEINP